MMPDTEGPEALVVSKQIMLRVLDAVESELSPLGKELLQRLIIDEQPIPDICEELGMKRNAIYMWRSRLTKRIRQLGAELMSDRTPTPRTSHQEDSR